MVRLNRGLFGVLLLALAGCSSTTTSTGASGKNDAANAAELKWEQFESAEGGFSVLFPGKAGDFSPGGDSVKAIGVELPGGTAYMVTWSDHTDEVKRLGANRTLVTARDLEIDGKKLLHDKGMVVRGHPARVVATIDPEGDVMHTWLILADNRLFHVGIITAKAKYSADDKNLAKFLESFELRK